MAKIKLYRISQNKPQSKYGVYESAIVAARSPQDARTIHPVEDGAWDGWIWARSPDGIEAQYIGVAGTKIQRGVIQASFSNGHPRS